MKSGRELLIKVVASICCFTLLFAAIAGGSGLSYLETLIPFSIDITIIILCFTWYQKLNTRNQPDCNCETEAKLKLIQLKQLLRLQLRKYHTSINSVK